jgi:hypothetical protein
MGHVLVLNASYEPLNITTWRRAMVMLLKGKAEGLEHESVEWSAAETENQLLNNLTVQREC